MQSETTTEAKLRKRVEALENAVGGKQSHHVSRLPVVSCSVYQRATWLTQRLKDAVEAHVPAEVHVFVNLFEPNIWLDPETNMARVKHKGATLTLPLDKLTEWWLDAGQVLPTKDEYPAPVIIPQHLQGFEDEPPL